jgi:hypothetical protein
MPHRCTIITCKTHALFRHLLTHVCRCHVQAFTAVSSVLGNLTEGQVSDVLAYHVSATRVALVPWAPTGIITTKLGTQTLELLDTR